MLHKKVSKDLAASEDIAFVVFGGFNRYNYSSLWQRHHEVATRLKRFGSVTWIEYLNYTNSESPKYLYNVLRRFVKRTGLLDPDRSPDAFLLPLLVPLPASGVASRINERMWKRALRKIPEAKRRVAWIYQPTLYAAQVVAAGRFDAVVYDCVQDFSSSHYPAEAAEADAIITEHADVVICDSVTTWKRKSSHRDKVFLVPQGWPPAFRQVEMPAARDPREICYLGSFHSDFDWQLLGDLAGRLPGHRFTLIGPSPASLRIEVPTNVRFLGHISHEQLPEELSKYAIGLIPYADSEHAQSVFPTKFLEYLAAGLDVVSTPLPDLMGMEGPAVRLSGSLEELARAIEKLAEPATLPARESHREKLLNETSWDDRFDAIKEALRGTSCELQEAQPLRKKLEHLVLAGIDFHPQMRTGDKNFWHEALPYLAQTVSEISIVSLVNRAGLGGRDQYNIGDCRISAEYIEIKEGVVRGPGRRGIIDNIGHAREKRGLGRPLRRALHESSKQGWRDSSPVLHLMDNFGTVNKALARALGVPTSVSAITYMGNRLPLYKPYIRSSFRDRALNVIAYSRTYSDWLEDNGVPKGNVHFARWGVPVADRPVLEEERREAKRQLGLEWELPLVMWAGYICQIGNKELWEAYRLAESFVSGHPQAQFFFALKPECYGDGHGIPRPSNKQIRVEATTVQNFGLLRQAADVLLSFTSNPRSILAPPLTWLEMLSRGTPIVTLSTPGADEIVIEGKSGFLAEALDGLPHQLERALDLAPTMRESSHRLAKEFGCVRENSRQFLEIWQRMAAKEQPR